MKSLIKLALIAAVAVVGYNLSQGNDPFANPFAEKSLLQTLQDGGDELLDSMDSSKILDSMNDSMEETLDDLKKAKE